MQIFCDGHFNVHLSILAYSRVKTFTWLLVTKGEFSISN
jgi:hypothetical protein